jgi:CheY-like chemotaxis protein
VLRARRPHLLAVHDELVADQLRARDVVELSAGEAERRGLKAGDRLTWAARGVNGAVPTSARIPDGNGQAAAPASPVRPIRVLLASRDDDFMRLAHFLLTRNGFTVETTKKISQAVDLVGRFWLDVVVLDASESLSEAARTNAAIEALHPQVSVLLVSDDERPKPNAALKVADKWEAMETLTEDIRQAHTSATQ